MTEHLNEFFKELNKLEFEANMEALENQDNEKLSDEELFVQAGSFVRIALGDDLLALLGRLFSFDTNGMFSDAAMRESYRGMVEEFPIYGFFAMPYLREIDLAELYEMAKGCKENLLREGGGRLENPIESIMEPLYRIAKENVMFFDMIIGFLPSIVPINIEFVLHNLSAEIQDAQENDPILFQKIKGIYFLLQKQYGNG